MPLSVNPTVYNDGVRNIQSADLTRHGIGYVSVSAFGISTPGIEMPNDGADFGPDSLLNGGPGVTGPPFTTTGGQAEANTYLTKQGGGLALLVDGQSLVITPSAGNAFNTPYQIGAGGGALPATSVTGPYAFGASPVVGTSLYYARGDHGHGLPPEPSVGTAAWSSIYGKTSYTVSAIGLSTPGVTIANDGCDFGPDSVGTTTTGLQEAENTGLSYYVQSGTFQITTSLIVSNSNKSVWLDPGAVINVASGVTFPSLDGISGSTIWTQMVIFGNCSNVDWYGGTLQNQNSSNSSISGFVFAGNTSGINLYSPNITGMTRWAHWITGYSYVASASFTADGPVSAITVQNPTVTNCGNTTTPDGGFFKVDLNATSGGVTGVTVFNPQATGLLCMGFDIENDESRPGVASDIQVIGGNLAASSSVSSGGFGLYVEASHNTHGATDITFRDIVLNGWKVGSCCYNINQRITWDNVTVIGGSTFTSSSIGFWFISAAGGAFNIQNHYRLLNTKALGVATGYGITSVAGNNGSAFNDLYFEGCVADDNGASAMTTGLSLANSASKPLNSLHFVNCNFSQVKAGGTIVSMSGVTTSAITDLVFTSCTGIAPQTYYTFSSSLICDGSSFGSWQASGSMMNAFYQAVATVVANGGGTIYFPAGTYVPDGPLVITGTSMDSPLTLVFDPAAIFQLNGSSSSPPTGHIKVGTNVRYPHVILVSTSHVELCGGQWTSNTAIGSQADYTGGVHVAGAVDHFEMHQMSFQSLTNFAFHASGGYTNGTGLPTGAPTSSVSSTGYSYINEHDDYGDTMGNAGQDGGMLRFGNDNTYASPAPVCEYIWAGSGTVSTNTQQYGVNIANGSMAGNLSHIHIEGFTSTGMPLVNDPGSYIGLNMENAGISGPGVVQDFSVRDCHFEGGYTGGLVGANYYSGIVERCTFIGAWGSGFTIGCGINPNAGATSNIVLRDLRCLNNCQGASGAGISKLGLGIGISSASTNGYLYNITVEGGDFSDYQGAGATQFYGLGIYNDGGPTATMDSIIVLPGWQAIGNKTTPLFLEGAIGNHFAGAGATNYNITNLKVGRPTAYGISDYWASLMPYPFQNYPAWNNTTAYAIGMCVSDGGVIYICIKATTAGADEPPNATYWAVQTTSELSPRGSSAAPVAGVNYNANVFPVVIYASGGIWTATIMDADNNVVTNTPTSLVGYSLPLGWSVSFSGVPSTVNIYAAA